MSGSWRWGLMGTSFCLYNQRSVLHTRTGGDPEQSRTSLDSWEGTGRVTCVIHMPLLSAACTVLARAQGSLGSLSFRVPHSRKGAEGAQNPGCARHGKPKCCQEALESIHGQLPLTQTPALPLLNLVFVKCFLSLRFL